MGEREHSEASSNVSGASSTCSYRYLNGSRCLRKIMGPKPFCSLHYGCDSDAADEIPQNTTFSADFNLELQNNNGNWEGFVFPPRFKIPSPIRFAVNASNVKFHSAILRETVFEKSIDFSNGLFLGDTSFERCQFLGNALFNEAKFGGPTKFSHTIFDSQAHFDNALFRDRLILSAMFKQRVSFSNTVFDAPLVVSGWRNISLSTNEKLFASSHVFGQNPGTRLRIGWEKRKEQILELLTGSVRHCYAYLKRQTALTKKKAAAIKRKLAKEDANVENIHVFHGDVSFQGAIFTKPDKVVFTHVDLSRAELQRSNFRGVRFLGVNWWQEGLKRNAKHGGQVSTFASPPRFTFISIAEYPIYMGWQVRLPCA